MNLAALRSRVRALRRKLVLARAQVILYRMAEEECLEWARAQDQGKTPSRTPRLHPAGSQGRLPVAFLHRRDQLPQPMPPQGPTPRHRSALQNPDSLGPRLPPALLTKPNPFALTPSKDHPPAPGQSRFSHRHTRIVIPNGALSFPANHCHSERSEESKIPRGKGCSVSANCLT